MGRGLGEFQVRLQTMLKGRRILRNRALWELAEASNKATATHRSGLGVPFGRIDPSLEKQFNKALHALEARGLVASSQVAPTGWPDVVVHHPFQTTKLELRFLRECLLRHLPREGALYGVAANESHMLQARPRVEQAQFEELWSRVEPELRLTMSTNRLKKTLFHLIVRGEEMFASRRLLGVRVSCSAAFSALVTEAERDGDLPKALLDALRQLSDLAFPPEELLRQQHKSALLPVGNFGTGRSSLNQPAKDALYVAMPELVRSLPGHREFPRAGFGMSRPREYSPLLDQLVDRNAFRMLDFVSAG